MKQWLLRGSRVNEKHLLNWILFCLSQSTCFMKHAVTIFEALSHSNFGFTEFEAGFELQCAYLSSGQPCPNSSKTILCWRSARRLQQKWELRQGRGCKTSEHLGAGSCPSEVPVLRLHFSCLSWISFIREACVSSECHKYRVWEEEQEKPASSSTWSRSYWMGL